MDKVKEVLNALADWFIADKVPADYLKDTLGEFVKNLLDTIVNALFPVE
jgi:hypothetical protein